MIWTPGAAVALGRMQLPVSVLGSRLLQDGGVKIVRGLLPAGLVDALVADAHAAAPKAGRITHPGPNQEDWRGGQPSRAMAGACAGPEQFRIFASAPMREAVSDLCGLALRCAGAGSYSWYTQPGDHLSLHRDIVACDVAVITCLERNGPPAPASGTLCVYPDDCWTPLRQVDAAGRRAVVLGPGDTVVLAGGVVPHQVTPTIAGQRRVVSIVCFQLQ